jgi:ribosomal protein S27AE
MTEHRHVCPKCGHVVVTYTKVTAVHHTCPKDRGKPVYCKEASA